jgi:hypothetical protein
MALSNASSLAFTSLNAPSVRQRHPVAVRSTW